MFNVLCRLKRPPSISQLKNLVRHFAAPAPAAKGPGTKIVAPTGGEEDGRFIDMDTEKLVKFCCVNYMKEGKEMELKPDSEYPSWLFELRLGPPPELDELDPNFYPYWVKLREIYDQQMQLRKVARFKSGYVQRLNLKKRDYEVFAKDEDKPFEFH